MPTSTGNKQFVVLFLLVTVFLTATSIAIALIMKEGEGLDVTIVQNDLIIIIDQSLNAIQIQEDATDEFVVSVDSSLDVISNANNANMVLAFNAIKQH